MEKDCDSKIKEVINKAKNVELKIIVVCIDTLRMDHKLLYKLGRVFKKIELKFSGSHVYTF
ncbi:MAG: hypothetical protein LBL02_00665 [Endomicrobium sp.]|jgi:hypothetical protein|nr:hypothetical protein [Endomicrobium sp.]